MINFFITFLLLQLTAKICKKDAKTFRLILASCFGGLYSLIILLDKLPTIVLLFSKIISAIIILAIAFSYQRIKSLVFSLACFLLSSFLFLGFIIGVYSFTNTNNIVINNNTVYYNIGAREMLFCAFLSYMLASVIIRLHNKSLAKNEIYTLEVFSNNKTKTLFAFVDTGNKLKEPFSNYPIIIAKDSLVRPLVNDKVRVVPTSTVNNNNMLIAFKPDKVIIKTSKGTESIENVYIALTDSLENENFSAIINPEILTV